MQKIGKKYIFTCVAIISVSLAIWQMSPPEPIVMDIDNSIVSRPEAIHAFVFYNVRPCTSILGVATLMHLISGMLGLRGWFGWMFSICTPTVVAFGYHLWWLNYVYRNGIHYPRSLTSADVFILDLLGFTIGFIVVSFALKLLFRPGNEPYAESNASSG